VVIPKEQEESIANGVEAAGATAEAPEDKPTE